MLYKVLLNESQCTTEVFKKINFNIDPVEFIEFCKANGWVDGDKIVIYQTSSEEHYNEFKNTLDEVLNA